MKDTIKGENTMKSVMLFFCGGSVKFCSYNDGTYSIHYKSNWNSSYNYDLLNLSFQEFIIEVRKFEK